ncbi:MAG: hypothetical protein JWP28_2478, partial [Phenylobacterium sp.]|nr:hypothetical protein [Phenylobacterium sp.]
MHRRAYFAAVLTAAALVQAPFALAQARGAKP